MTVFFFIYFILGHRAPQWFSGVAGSRQAVRERSGCKLWSVFSVCSASTRLPHLLFSSLLVSRVQRTETLQHLNNKRLEFKVKPTITNLWMIRIGTCLLLFHRKMRWEKTKMRGK